jgi:hypothetical protein
MILYREGKELSDDEATMEFYGIMPQEILDLSRRSDAEIKARERKDQGPEIGFSGTGLVARGYPSSANGHSSPKLLSQEDADEEFARKLQEEQDAEEDSHRMGWTCSQCTFYNATGDSCAICEYTNLS